MWLKTFRAVTFLTLRSLPTAVSARRVIWRLQWSTPAFCQLKHIKPSLNYSKVALMWFHTDLYPCGEELTRSEVIRFSTRGCPRLIPQHLSKQDEQHETTTPWKSRASDVIYHVERRRYFPHSLPRKTHVNEERDQPCVPTPRVRINAE